MKSVTQDKKQCYICGNTTVEKHHVFMGALRKVSEKLGLVVWLCPEHHRGDYSPHQNRELDLRLKKEAQERFTGTFEEWMDPKNGIGKNYL